MLGNKRIKGKIKYSRLYYSLTWTFFKAEIFVVFLYLKIFRPTNLCTDEFHICKVYVF